MFLLELSFFITSQLVKLSILYFYRRIFENMRFRMFANLMIITTTSFMLGSILTVVLQCR
jgi:hypothetical protein